ncbi:MAG: polysaccharide biosynthesis/export family protein [Verrucomicrobiota bacterium]
MGEKKLLYNNWESAGSYQKGLGVTIVPPRIGDFGTFKALLSALCISLPVIMHATQTPSDAIPFTGDGTLEPVTESSQEPIVEPPTENYLLAPFDKVAIRVFDEPELDSAQRITSRGEITLPLLGTVKVAGLSIEQTKDNLERLYVEQKFLRQPAVFVAIEEFSPKRITILGEIGSPSSFELPIGANYVEIEAAIAMAGGFTDLARKSSVRVTRKSEPDGREKVEEVDMDDVLFDDEEGFATTRYRIYPGDILYVPRRFF